MRTLQVARIWSISPGAGPDEVLVACGRRVLRFTVRRMDDYLASIREEFLFRPLYDDERSDYGLRAGG